MYKLTIHFLEDEFLPEDVTNPLIFESAADFAFNDGMLGVQLKDTLISINMDNVSMVEASQVTENSDE